MLAASVPLLKQAAVASAALGLMVGLAVPHHHLNEHRLSLHAPARCNAIYLTAWAHGDVTIKRDDASPQPITFQTRGVIPDGCTWLGIETLVPIDAHRYYYEYNEEILSCPEGATRYIKTPRQGIVTVED